MPSAGSSRQGRLSESSNSRATFIGAAGAVSSGISAIVGVGVGAGAGGGAAVVVTGAGAGFGVTGAKAAAVASPPLILSRYCA